MKKLFVIEAPGKVEKLRSILDALLDEKFDVFATKGRLFDLPRDSYGLDTEAKAMQEVPISNYILSQLKEKIKVSDRVYIATDNDIEGEKIALDVAKLCSGKSKYERITFSSLQTNIVQSGIDNPREIDHFMVDAAKSKRYMDRFLGYSEDQKYPLGRVVTPILEKASKENQKTGILAKTVNLDRGEFQLLVELYGSSLSEIKAASTALSSSKINIDEANLVFKESEAKDMASLWNGKQALLNISAALNMPISEVQDHLQDLYEDGRISYPRSDLVSVSEENAKKIEEIANHWSVRECFHEQVLEKGSLDERNSLGIIQEGHEALIPLDLSVNPFAKLNDLSAQDRVYSVLLRHALRVSKKNQKIKTVEVVNTKEITEEVKRVIRNDEIRVRLIKRNTFTPGMNVESPLYPEFMPCGVRDYQSVGEVKFRHISKEKVVAKMLYQTGLSRPSTFAHHAKKISSRFFYDNGTLNKRGDLALIHANQKMPTLLEIKCYHALEVNFMSRNKGYIEKIEDALLILGVNSKSGDTSKEKDHEIGFNI